MLYRYLKYFLLRQFPVHVHQFAEKLYFKKLHFANIFTKHYEKLRLSVYCRSYISIRPIKGCTHKDGYHLTNRRELIVTQHLFRSKNPLHHIFCWGEVFIVFASLKYQKIDKLNLLLDCKQERKIKERI